MIDLHVNGVRRLFEGDLDMPLLMFVRDELNLPGSKYGCGLGLCGACTMLIDGQAIRSCQVAMRDARGLAVTTIEGLSPDASHPLQKAWRALDVPQCGYCQSGMIMAAASLLKDTPKPTDGDIDAAITNICRCATYQRVRKAIHLAAAAGGAR